MQGPTMALIQRSNMQKTTWPTKKALHRIKYVVMTSANKDNSKLYTETVVSNADDE